jgi:hypothetical protein
MADLESHDFDVSIIELVPLRDRASLWAESTDNGEPIGPTTATSDDGDEPDPLSAPPAPEPGSTDAEGFYDPAAGDADDDPMGLL